MKLRIIIIDEPIHIKNKTACSLWQKTLWAKEEGYRNEYTSNILPLGVDDFIATHLIIADELKNGEFIPVAMYKVLRRSQCEKFNIPFGIKKLLKGTSHENSRIINKILDDPSEISYDSSWSINPEYKTDKEFSLLLRDYITLFGCKFHKTMGYTRWLTAGVQKFNIDNYFKWLGGEKLFTDIPLDIIDNNAVSMFYISNTNNIPPAPLLKIEKLNKDWENRIVFTPYKNSLKIAL